jgi:hypothetical protein
MEAREGRIEDRREKSEERGWTEVWSPGFSLAERYRVWGMEGWRFVSCFYICKIIILTKRAIS